MLKLPAYLTRYSSRSDGSHSVGIVTQELSEEDVLELKRHHNKFGWFVFKENELQAEDIPKEEASGGKTPSQELRQALKALWHKRKENGNKGEWADFYNASMARFKDIVIGKIKELE